MTPEPLRRYLRRRDRRSFTRLVEAERDVVLGAALRFLGDRARAEDATQEVFMKLLPPHGPDEPPQHGRAWLVRRALEAARGQLRAERRRRGREEAHAVPEALRPELDAAESAELREAVAQLPERLRACVELRYFGGLAAREIADVLGLARRSVDERLAAARGKLRTRLSGHAGAVLAAALESTWRAPRPDASPALRAKLEALALQAGGASLLGGALLGVCAAGALAAVAAIALWTGDGGAPERITAAAPGRDDASALDTIGRASTPDALPTPGTRSSNTTRPSAPNDASPREPAPTFIIEVVDERGALVRTGHAELAVASSNVRSPGSGPRAGPWRLGPRSLADANPILLPPMPESLRRVPLHARALAPGYGSAAPAYLDALAEESPQVLRLVLPRPRELLVEVLVNGSGEAIPGALVIACSELERRDREVLGLLTPTDGEFVARTDALGRCTLRGLGGGRLSLEVHAPGYRSRMLVDLVPGTTGQVYLDPDAESASITALAVDPDGAPLANVPVTCARLSLSGARRMHTDALGRARFDGLAAGNWVVRIDGPAFSLRAQERGWSLERADVERRLYLTEAQHLETTLGYVGGDASWRVELRHPNGSPVADREVTINKNTSRCTGRTDALGVVLFEDLEPGAWYLFMGAGWPPNAHLVKAGETLRSTFVIGDRTVRGSATDEQGAPLAGVSIAFGDTYIASARTDGQGRFELTGAPPDEYVVHAYLYGRPGVSTSLTVEPALDPPPLRIVLPRGGRLVVDVPGSAERGVLVAAVSRSGQHFWLTRDATAAERFVDDALAPGDYTLIVRKGRKTIHESRESVAIHAGETTEASIDLPE